MENLQFTTAGLDHTQALSAWASKVREHVSSIEIDSPARDNFAGGFQQLKFGCTRLTEILARQQNARNSTSRSHSPSAGFDLVFMRRGTFALRQAGKSCQLGTGDFALVDMDADFSFVSSDGSQSFSLNMPRDWLSRRLGDPDAYIGRSFTSQTPWGRVLKVSLEASWKSNSNVAPHGIAEQLAGALTAAIDGEGNRRSRHGAQLLAALRRDLRDRCREAGLQAADIANGYGISVRYLHLLFANAGSSFAAELMSFRLEEAARLLGDPHFSGWSVTDISGACGFADSSHFARRFRASFDISPSQFRFQKCKPACAIPLDAGNCRP